MSDEKISLPDGGWALLRDPRRVTERQRRPVTRLQAKVMGSAVGALLAEKERREAAGEAAGPLDEWFTEESRKLMGSQDYMLLDDYNDALIEALVAEWSYDGTPSADAALDLPGEAYEALKAECAKHMNALTVNFSPDNAQVETSPTEPSVD